jgi:hypothetical protein
MHRHNGREHETDRERDGKKNRQSSNNRDEKEDRYRHKEEGMKQQDESESVHSSIDRDERKIFN